MSFPNIVSLAWRLDKGKGKVLLFMCWTAAITQYEPHALQTTFNLSSVYPVFANDSRPL